MVSLHNFFYFLVVFSCLIIEKRMLFPPENSVLSDNCFVCYVGLVSCCFFFFLKKLTFLFKMVILKPFPGNLWIKLKNTPIKLVFDFIHIHAFMKIL